MTISRKAEIKSGQPHNMWKLLEMELAVLKVRDWTQQRPRGKKQLRTS
jgi:hypothetical protein